MSYSGKTWTSSKMKAKQPKEHETTLAAAAFQDQLVRSMGALSLGDPIGPRIPRLNKMKNYKKEAHSVINTGLNKKSGQTSTAEKEYVLDPPPAPVTLAQKLGLVRGPSPRLSENEWANVKAQSNAREDSRQPCVICKEDWGGQEQVLLSCSHVFHRSCLQAFERFSGKKSCPMCRREQYQTRVIHEGAHAYRHKCATRIQALWRGHVVRCWYRQLRKTVPPKDPTLRKKFYQEKLTEITDRLVRSMDYDVNVFLTDIDHSLEESRYIFKNFDSLMTGLSEEEWDEVQLKALQRGATECPICLTDLDRVDKTRPSTAASSTATKSSKNNQAAAEPSNHASKKKSQKPGEPNILASKKLPGAGESSNPVSKKNQGTGEPSASTHSSKKPTSKNTCNKSSSGDCEVDDGIATRGLGLMKEKALLSCSHVFHMTCLLTFEELTVGDRKFTCPVCRAHYQKKSVY